MPYVLLSEKSLERCDMEKNDQTVQNAKMKKKFEILKYKN
jgi:hypothetical protein